MVCAKRDEHVIVTTLPTQGDVWRVAETSVRKQETPRKTFDKCSHPAGRRKTLNFPEFSSQATHREVFRSAISDRLTTRASIPSAYNHIENRGLRILCEAYTAMNHHRCHDQ